MKATILPRKGKHYGTKIKVEEDGEYVLTISIWGVSRGDLDRPSERELDYQEICSYQYENNTLIDPEWGIRAKDLIDCGHYETERDYLLACTIERAINESNS